MGGRGVSAGHPAAHTHFRACYATLLRELYELCLGVVLCLTKPAFMRRPWRIKALPVRPWPGISAFLGHNSTFSMQLRYSPARKCVCAARVPGAYATYVVTIIYDFRYNKYSRFKYQRYLNLGEIML